MLLAKTALMLALLVPTQLVDPFVGTSGTPIGGPIDTFPGADVPFGMVQWSPDTPSQDAGGGYDYADRDMTGFSLTHLSGPGCSVFGDFAFLPFAGPLPHDPLSVRQPFSHASEEMAPGWYAVTLGNPAIRAELTVTKRTGLARFTFPATQQATLIVNAASNQAGVTDAHVRVDSPTQISGSASSGFFCGMPDAYTVYFVARFNRPMHDHGILDAGRAAWIGFDPSGGRRVDVKVGLSFVSIAGATANLDAEGNTWDVVSVRNRATETWDGLLRRVQIDGGTPVQRRTFYTALYHTLLHPNLISDVDGAYTGFDGKIHRARRGHAEYANVSDWDVYRTEIPLIALIAPSETSDMMQSLVDAYRQEGWLPRWALVNGPTSVMGGDSVDPVIAGAYAFGARGFDARTALNAMVKGATTTAGPPGQGWYIERWELDDDYLRRGYVVNTHVTSVAPAPNGASETLEYALDDFSIARFAGAIGNESLYAQFMRRASNWVTLFDTSTGWIEPRDADGAFMRTPITENGQSGFQEGTGAQYTWMVPQDLHDLIGGMGGDAAAIAKLDTFFSQLNAGQNQPYAWLGNEPSLGSPWIYLTAGEPWRTQQIVRQALTTLYTDAPDGLPGNDDLGTMSAWYVWCAMGLYPQNPAVRVLDIGSPLFDRITLRSPNGPTIEIRAPYAATALPYVRALRVDGKLTQHTSIALPQHGTLRLDFDLTAAPEKRWGSGPNDAPPSYPSGPMVFPSSTPAFVEASSAETVMVQGATETVSFAVDNRSGKEPVAIRWQARAPAGIALQPNSGTTRVPAGSRLPIALRVSADLALRSGYYGLAFAATTANGTPLETVRHAVRVGSVPEMPEIAYAENRFGNTISPVDLDTHTAGAEIPVGEQPRDAVLARDGRLLFVANMGSASVSVIDTAEERAIATIPVGQSPNGLALSPDGKTVWLANNDDGTVQPIDVASRRAGSPIRVGLHPRSIAIAPDGSTLYVTDSGSNDVTPVDVVTRAASPPIAVGARPFGIAISPNGKRLYVVDNGSNDVTPIDLATGRALAPVPVGVSPMLIAIAPNGATAYVTNYANSFVTPIDLSTDVAEPPIDVGGAPYGVAFSHDGKTAVVVIRRDDACVTIDVAHRRVSAPIMLGNSPYTIAL